MCFVLLLGLPKINFWLFKLVENEEVIGVLIETNDRIIAALEMYDHLATADPKSDQSSIIAKGLAATHIHADGEVNKLQEKQKAAVAKAKHSNGSTQNGATGGVFADLQDLNFGTLGASSSNLPPPIRPTSMSEESTGADARGSLSDFSDYESSDEETHNAQGSSSKYPARDYYSSEDEGVANTSHPVAAVADDPFADPFAD